MARLFLAVFLLVGIASALEGSRSDVAGIQSRQPLLKAGSTRNISPNIISGEEAEVGEFPYQISLQATDRFGQKFHNCGGSIYDEDTIITAAHCVKGYDPNDLRIVAGDHDLFIDEGTEQVRSIKSYIYNPYFDDRNLDNDTAVIKLSSPLVFNSRVQPIRINEPNEEPVGECVNSGWGNTNPNNPYMPEKLQKVYLDIIERLQCNRLYSGVNTITPGMVCAGRAGGKGACNGDSGGPLVCTNSKGEKVLAGAVSWGINPCGQDKYPSVYANVAHYYSWIRENL
jgi:secreted trypsin-like serine protease